MHKTIWINRKTKLLHIIIGRLKKLFFKIVKYPHKRVFQSLYKHSLRHYPYNKDKEISTWPNWKQWQFLEVTTNRFERRHSRQKRPWLQVQSHRAVARLTFSKAFKKVAIITDVLPRFQTAKWAKVYTVWLCTLTGLYICQCNFIPTEETQRKKKLQVFFWCKEKETSAVVSVPFKVLLFFLLNKLLACLKAKIYTKSHVLLNRVEILRKRNILIRVKGGYVKMKNL